MPNFSEYLGLSNLNSTETNLLINGTIYEKPPLSVLITIGIVFPIAILLSVFGNGFTIYAFLRFKSLRTPFNFYIVNLAVADLVVGVILMPAYVVYNYNGYWPLGEPLCSVWIFIDWFVTFESVLTLALIGMERLWSVTWPVSYRNQHKPKNALIIVLLTWLWVCCVWAPGFFNDRINHENVAEDCNWDLLKNYSAAIFVGTVGYFIPYGCVVVCYSYVAWKMRARIKQIIPKVMWNGQVVCIAQQTSTDLANNIPSTHMAHSGKTRDHYENIEFKPAVVRESHSSNEKKSKQQKRQVKSHGSKSDNSGLIISGAIVLVFSVCWLPMYGSFFIAIFQWIEQPQWFLVLTSWLVYLNSVANPILYALLHREFRRIFLETFMWSKRPNR